MNQGRPDFFDHASCRGVDTNVFFPEKGGRQLLAAARRICEGCSVRSECLTWSLEMARHVDLHGVFAGLTAAERDAELRRLGHTKVQRTTPHPHGTVAGYVRHQHEGTKPCPSCVDARSRFYEFNKPAEVMS